MIGDYYKIKKECNVSDATLFLVPQIVRAIGITNSSILNHLYNYGLINSYIRDDINDPDQLYKNHLFMLFDKDQISAVNEKTKTPLSVTTTKIVGGMEQKNQKVVSYLEFFQENSFCVETYDVLDSYIMIVIDLFKIGITKEDLLNFELSQYSKLSNDFSRVFLQPLKSKKYTTDYSGFIIYNVIKKTDLFVTYLMDKLNVQEKYLDELHEKINDYTFNGKIKRLNFSRFQEDLEIIFNELKKLDKEIEIKK